MKFECQPCDRQMVLTPTPWGALADCPACGHVVRVVRQFASTTSR